MDTPETATARKRVRITEAENARLIRLAGAEPLSLSFGPSGVFLDPECTWPLPLLAEWRGITFNDGAGI
jgi:hypothetical protein